MMASEALLLDHLGQMIFLVEPESLRIDYANRVVERMLGYSGEQLRAMTILDVECSLQDVFYWEEIRNGQLSAIEAQEGVYLCGDGSMWPATKTVQVIEMEGQCRLLVQASPTSGVATAAENLAYTMSQLRATLESTGNGILVLDWQGKVASMNRQFSGMWSIPEGLLLRQDDQAILDFVADQLVDAEVWQQRMRIVVDENETKDLLHLKSGSVFECKSLPQYLDERIIGRVFAFNDLTERIRIEDDLIAARQRAEMANQAKAAFLAMMSHEIRTPMNGVMGMTTLLFDTPLNDEQRRYLDIIRSSSESLLSVINDVLDFSKIEAHKLALEAIDFSLPSLLEDFSDLMALRAAEKGIEYAWVMDRAVPERVCGDPGRVRQILTNLVGNAIKFTEVGTISVRVSRLPDRDDEIVLQIEVSDSGIGIAEEDLPKIFAPFEQADSSTTRRYGGTGLGLTITRQLIGLMGGDISVASRLGDGTSFVFSLALRRAADRPASAEGVLSTAADDVSMARVLVVDDFEVSRQGLVERLWRCGYAADAVGNAEAALLALRHARDSSRPYRALIVDQSLPGNEGESLGRQVAVAEEYRGIVLVLCVAAGFRGDAQRIHDAGFAAYVHKPARKAVLQECLQRLTHSFPAEAPTQTQPVVSGALPNRSCRLLVVEDNAINMVVVKGLLGKLGFSQIDKARDGVEAVDAAQEVSYDLIFMDCQMPHMDGYEATRRLRELGVGTPIVAMTAHALSGEREKCLEAGMDDYLSKPLSLDQLKECLARWLPE
ncbi:PAS domain-containing hybrid sensor histidine kinase/response regulator [Propionivibrio dicarboxylicus]|uniref:Sensory/regulatory protein RpfC n=1 Tax=Propionivibrio dicarboxylicus TaxID=83767 RepID=A0A1G7VL28_9RHOO|nr:PAS domain-containing hybrid sensor histidine kinase/response regulator [Propionivibrio dicarboxylicus]SDG60453.1 Signal transduction histidine kinase [Propionivibrio dicarboxylicus]